MKCCNRCREQKPLDAFGKQRNAPDGLRYACKACTAERYKAWREANPEIYRSSVERWRKANPDRVRGHDDARRARDPERHRAKSRADYRKHKERYREAHRRWLAKPENVEKQKEAVRLATKAWRQNNATHRKAYEKAYRTANPEIYRDADARKRAKRREAPGRFAKADIAALLETQAGLCAYCSEDITAGFHIDHKMPLARGGTNWPDNLCLACAPCNQSKHTKTVEEFRRSIGL